MSDKTCGTCRWFDDWWDEDDEDCISTCFSKDAPMGGKRVFAQLMPPDDCHEPRKEGEDE